MLFHPKQNRAGEQEPDSGSDHTLTNSMVDLYAQDPAKGRLGEKPGAILPPERVKEPDKEKTLKKRAL